MAPTRSESAQVNRVMSAAHSLTLTHTHSCDVADHRGSTRTLTEPYVRGDPVFGFQRGAAVPEITRELGEGASGLRCEPKSKKHIRPCQPY